VTSSNTGTKLKIWTIRGPFFDDYNIVKFHRFENPFFCLFRENGLLIPETIIKKTLRDANTGTMKKCVLLSSIKEPKSTWVSNLCLKNNWRNIHINIKIQVHPAKIFPPLLHFHPAFFMLNCFPPFFWSWVVHLKVWSPRIQAADFLSETCHARLVSLPSTLSKALRRHQPLHSR